MTDADEADFRVQPPGPRRRKVGRPERPVDPADGPLALFADGLRQLRAMAGYPTYRALAARAQFSASVLSTAASGTAFPTLRVTLAYAVACGASATEWQHRWEATASELAQLPEPVPEYRTLGEACAIGTRGPWRRPGELTRSG